MQRGSGGPERRGEQADFIVGRCQAAFGLHEASYTLDRMRCDIRRGHGPDRALYQSAQM